VAIGLKAVRRKCGQRKLQVHRRQSWKRLSTLKNEGEDPDETLVNMYQTTRRHIQTDSILLKTTCSLSSSDCNTKIFLIYRGADKSVARPGRKQANVSVRIA